MEDVFHTRSQNRSKADYFSKHLFLRILCHQLGEEGDLVDPTQSPAHGSTLTGVPRTMSPEPIDDDDESQLKGKGDDGTVYDGGLNSYSQSTTKKRRLPLLPNSRRDLEAMLGGGGDTGGGGRSQSSLARLLRSRGEATEARQQEAEHEVTLDALKRVCHSISRSSITV